MLRALTRLNQNFPINRFSTFTGFRNTIFTKRTLSTERQLVRLIDAVRQSDEKQIALIAKDQPRFLEQQTRTDDSPLHIAAEKGDLAAIELIEKEFPGQFDPNYKCHCLPERNRTPMHYAAKGGHKSVVEKLFSMGGNPNIQDAYGRTALDFALENNHHDLAILIAKKGGIANKMKAQESFLKPRLSAHLFAEKFSESKKSEQENNFKELIVDLTLSIPKSKS